jgi:3-phosphoshikimate 1-carboxyvinyltransferase
VVGASRQPREAASPPCYHPVTALKIEPASSFRGRFRLPGDKSISHRAALFGALASGPTRVRNYSSAADCESTLRCLQALGVTLQRDGSLVTVEGRGPEAWAPPPDLLDAGNSGTTLRLLAGPLAGRPFRSVLSGDESLRRRPVERVAAPLRAMGATATTTDGHPPLTIQGGALRGITWEMPVASAQVKTAVLLAGLQADGKTTVREPAASRDHTERMLPVFGVEVEREGLSATVRGGARLRGAQIVVPGDASSAAFLVVAALVLPDAEVHLDGVLLSPTRIGFVDVLRAMGGRVETRLETTTPEPVGSIFAASSRLHGTTVDPARVASLIDEVPALAVAACHAEGTFTLTGARELRVKESDRIAAIGEGLSRLGARVRELPDGLVVEGGGRLRGATVRSAGDHRIAMALTVAALAAEGPTEIEGAECVNVSFPEFFGLLQQGAGRG